MPTYLSVVEGAFRATPEEQDDAALWFTAAVRNSGSDRNLLLQSTAVHYALLNQQRPRLEIGDMVVENPPEFDEDLLRVGSRQRLQHRGAVYARSGERFGIERQRGMQARSQITRAAGRA